jgi:hypothetical protein
MFKSTFYKEFKGYNEQILNARKYTELKLRTGS